MRLIEGMPWNRLSMCHETDSYRMCHKALNVCHETTKVNVMKQIFFMCHETDYAPRSRLSVCHKTDLVCAMRQIGYVPWDRLSVHNERLGVYHEIEWVRHGMRHWICAMRHLVYVPWDWVCAMRDWVYAIRPIEGHPFSFLNSSWGLSRGKTFPENHYTYFRLVLQNFAISGYFPYILLYRYLFSLLSSGSSACGSISVRELS